MRVPFDNIAHVFLALLIFSAPVVCRSAPLTSEGVYQKILPSVMTLTVTAKNGDTVQGTGFIAIKSGVAVTAWHVVHDAKSVTAKFSDGQEYEVSGLIDKDEKRDVALIKVKVFGKPLLSLAETAPEVGSKAYVIGAPKGLEFSITDGLISQVRNIDSKTNYQFSCPASPGNSGGPLTDSEGKVVGVVDWQVTEGQNLNFAVPSTDVLGLDATLPTKPWDSVKADVAVSASDNTEIDGDFAEALMTLYDSETAFAILHDQIYVNSGFKSPTPQCCYDLEIQTAKRLDELSSVTTNDPIRQKISKTLIAALKTAQAVMQLDADALSQAREAQSWTGNPDDLVIRANSVHDAIERLTVSQWELLNASPSFQAKLTPSIITLLTPQKPIVILGVYQWTHGLCAMPLLVKKALADKLGFKSGDYLQTIAGQPATSLDDLRTAIKANIGKKLKVTVWRDGKAKELELNIPDPLPGQQ